MFGFFFGREFLQHLDRKQVHRTNTKCSIKTEILCDQQEPQIIANLENGKRIIFKTAYMTTLELLQYWNRFAKQFTKE
ncbi:hypothetical protein QR98_0077490 [Sarcoptes scabiei]|uniref:Large ribosomal subunit protein mL53 n=1 Tax=Sarcoptes scabiei TaxID=52283 RepID=A0A132AE00_SARSC|nr:hypothetical protein QR98_0077490 [Sarcoptes scabiei]